MLNRKGIIFGLLVLGAVIFGQFLYKKLFFESEKYSLNSTVLMEKELKRIDDQCLVETENSKLASFYKARNFSFGSEAWLKNKRLIIEQLIFSGEYESAQREVEELKNLGARGDYFDLVDANILFMQAKNYCSSSSSNSNIFSLMEKSHKAYSRLFEKTKSNKDLWLKNLTYSYLEQSDCEPIKIAKILSENSINLGLNSEIRAGGVVTEDINNDGYIDIVMTSHSLDERIKVFTYNVTKKRFDDVTKSSGLANLAGGLNLVQADYDNDGDVDLYISRGAWLSHEGETPDSLLENDGNGFFTDVTKKLGLYSKSPSQVAMWQDYDGDGYLDLFVGNETSVYGTREDKGKNILEEQELYPNKLYKNMGKAGFKDVALELGLADIGFTKGAGWGDFNADGLVDLYVSFFGGGNALYMHSLEGDIHRFTDVAESYAVSKPVMSFPVFVMDYNHDGYDDLYVANFRTDLEHEITGLWGGKVGPVGRLYENTQGTGFKDVTSQQGLDIPMSVMGANFGDIDNDGFFDFYFGTGSPSIEHWVPNRFFKYKAGQGYKEATNEYGLGLIDKGHGIAFTDLDNDGDQDIYSAMGGWFEADKAYNKVFINNSDHQNSWVTLRLEGKASNKGAIGSKVEIIVINENGSEQSYFHRVSSGGSFGAGSLQIEAGLGRISKIKSIVVTWPNAIRSKEKFIGFEKNKTHKIVEGSGALIVY